MSASHAPALDAITFQLAAALEDYDQAVDRMVSSCMDLELYRAVSEQIEGIRMYSSAMPELRVQWVELLIAHAELVHMLWKAQYAESGGGVVAVRARHTRAVAGMRSRCLRLLERRDTSGA